MNAKEIVFVELNALPLNEDQKEVLLQHSLPLKGRLQTGQSIPDKISEKTQQMQRTLTTRQRKPRNLSDVVAQSSVMHMPDKDLLQHPLGRLNNGLSFVYFIDYLARKVALQISI